MCPPSTRLQNGHQKPALILLDLMMPGMSGWEFRERQLRDSMLSDIPVIATTASRDLQGIFAAEVLYKPVTRARLSKLSSGMRASDRGRLPYPRKIGVMWSPIGSLPVARWHRIPAAKARSFVALGPWALSCARRTGPQLAWDLSEHGPRVSPRW